MEPQVRTEARDGLDPALIRKVKLGLIALGVIGVAVLVYFIVRDFQQVEVGKRWDEFTRIQDRYALTVQSQDPLFEGGPDTLYFQRRADLITELEAFLPRAESGDDALGPQVHWLIAKLAADQVVSQKDELDVQKRAVLWEKARTHMQAIVDRYPDFQTNWTMFAPTSHTSLTRAFLATIASNVKWEKKYLPRPKDPAADPVVVVRTERGDLRMRLYREDAKAITDLFLERAARGDYDGTAFYAKNDRKRGGAPLDVSARAGHPATRDAKPFDREGAQAFAKEEYADLLPAETRYLVPADRGVVLAWHDPATIYDGPQAFVVVQQRSPLLDYDYSPIGKLVDEASLATLDRIFAGDTWRDDVTSAMPPDGERDVADFLQVPVKIVKVLVYEGGTLVPAEAPAPTKATVEADEATLDGLKPDAYVTEPPVRPAPPPPAPPEEAPDAPEPSDDVEQPEAPGNDEAPGDEPGAEDDG